MMKYTITTVLFVALLSVLQAQIRIELNPELGDCFCEGTPQQPFMVTAEGSAGPFTYEWTGPNGYASTEKEPADITEAGSYELTVYNAYGCDFTYGVELEACPVPQYNILPNTCRGMLTLEIESGVGPFSVAWFDAVSETPLGETAYTINVQEGTYFAKVTDGNGCVLQTPPVVMAIDPIVIEATTAISPPSCATATDGSVTATVQSGGTPPYIYNWYDGAFTAIDNPSNVLTGVGAGEYRLVVEDGNGCRSNWVITNVEAAEESDQEAPYVQQVRVYVGEEGAGQTLIYKGWWTNDGTDCLDFNLDESLAADQSTIHRIQQGERIEVQAWTNTGMNALEMGFPGTGVSQSGVSEPLPIGQNVYWEFVFDNGVPNMLQEDSDIVQPLAFEGTSIEGGRPLLDLLQYSADLTACAPVPAQQPDCSWQPALVTGEDRVHEINIEGCEGLTEPAGSLCPNIGMETGCGEADGYISFRICHGFGNAVSPVTYEWSNGVTTRDNNWLSSGYYTLTVTDAVGCQGIFEYHVPSNSPDIPIIADSYTVKACSGSDNGEVSFFVGDADQLEWDDGLVEALSDPINDVEAYTREGLAAGQYCVSAVNTLSGCSIYKCFQVEENIPVETFEATAEIIEEQCHLQSNGRVQISFSGGQPPYYHNGEALLNYVIGQGYEYATSLEIDDLVEGNYCEDVMDHCGEVIQVCFDMPLNEESVFDIGLAGIQHTTVEGDNMDGWLEVNAVPANSYNYSWFKKMPNGLFSSLNRNNKRIENLPPGQYKVTVMLADGSCGHEAIYTIKSCEEVSDNFEISILGGFVASPYSSEDVPFYLFITEEDGTTSYQLPEGYSVQWYVNGDFVESYYSTLFVNSAEFLNEENPTVRVRVSNGCTDEVFTQQVYLCGEGTNPSDALVGQVDNPCEGNADGSIQIVIPNFFFSSAPDNIELYLVTENDEISLPLFSYAGGAGFSASVGGLQEGTHRFRLVVGDCDIDFDYLLWAKSPDLEFSEFVNGSNPACVYNEVCNDEVLGQVVASPILVEEEATNIPCRIPMECGGEFVGYKSYPYRTCRVFQYETLLRRMGGGIGSESPYSEFLMDASQYSGCAKVTYCTATMQPLAYHNFLTGGYGEPEYQGPNNDGCEIWHCGQLGLIGINRIVICGEEDECEQPVYYHFNEPEEPETVCDQYQSLNLYGLLTVYDDYLNGFISAGDAFYGTELEYELSTYIDDFRAGNLDWATCANAVFCGDDYSFYYVYQYGPSCDDVNIPIYDTYIDPFFIDEYTDPASGGLNYDGDQTVETCIVLEEATVLDGNGDIIQQTVQCQTNDCDDNPDGSAIQVDDCTETHVINYPEIHMALGIGGEGLVNDTVDTSILLMQDPFSGEDIISMGHLTYKGYTIPKLVLETSSGTNAYYDYAYGSNTASKKVYESLEHSISNWDTDQGVRVKFDSTGGHRIYYHDSLQYWVASIESNVDSLLDIDHVAFTDNYMGVEITGKFYGDLKIGGEVIGSASQLSAFILSLNREGALIDLDVFSNLYSHNRKMLTADHKGNKLFVTEQNSDVGSVIFDGTTIEAPPVGLTQSLLVGYEPEESYSFSLKKRFVAPEGVQVVASASSNNGSFGALIKHTGGITSQNSQLLELSEDTTKSIIVSFSENGSFIWSKSLSGRFSSKLTSMVYGEDGAMYLGITTIDDVILDGTLIEHRGKGDIVLCRFSPSGNLDWAKSYGTVEGETIEHLFVEKGVLFFAGRVYGDKIDRVIANRTIRDYTPYGPEVYVSEILLDSLSPQLALPNNEHEVLHKAHSTTQLTALYPNPSSGEITIELHSELAQQMDIELTDLMGRTLSKWPGMRLYRGMNKFNISPSSDIATGMYLLKLMPEDSQGRAIISKITRY